MDGSVRDLVYVDRRISLASVSYASATFPRFVLSLCLNRLFVHAPLEPTGIRVVWMTDSTDGRRLVVLSQDFDRIKSVADKFGPNPRLAPSEPESDTLARIEAEVRVSFSDRNEF